MSREIKITEEYARCRQTVYADLVKNLESGKLLAARHYFLYYVQAESWDKDLSGFIKKTDELYLEGDAGLKAEYLKMLVFLAIDLKSFAVNWVIAKENNPERIEQGYKKLLEKVSGIEKTDPQIAGRVLEYFREAAAGRLVAEAVSAEEVRAEVMEVCGNTLEAFILNTVKTIQSSNIFEMATNTKDQKSRMILGNDYGEYLNDTIWLGMSYTTTNPPLVNMVWDIDSEKWASKLEAAVNEEIEAADSGEDLILHACSLGALIVVEKNCKQLRGIFHSTSGNEGYACYQVNPENHDNPEGMINEIHYVYGLLEKRLGGIPNVSFKLPGTSAGLKAAEVLSSEGISLTITLEFGLFQAIEFAKVFHKGTAITSNLVVMNGRLAFPVRDELLENGVEGAEEAAKWAGVEVTRKLYRKLYTPSSEGGLGFDPKKVRIMNASLRIYGADIPDISEVIGSQVMTIFPNVRRAWDSVDRGYESGIIRNETPYQYMEILKKSEIFRQSWWINEDAQDGRPEKVLSLRDEDKEAVKNWVPVKATLDQFLSSYAALRTQVKEILKK